MRLAPAREAALPVFLLWVVTAPCGAGCLLTTEGCLVTAKCAQVQHERGVVKCLVQSWQVTCARGWLLPGL